MPRHHMKSDRFYLATLYHDYAIRTFCHDRNTAELYLHDLPSRNARCANESTYLPSVNKKLTLLETPSSNFYLCSFALSKFLKHHVVFSPSLFILAQTIQHLVRCTITCSPLQLEFLVFLLRVHPAGFFPQ
jgi:hypothetical protein